MLFEDFKVKPSFEGTMNSHWHFTVVKDGVTYSGHYDNGEIHWFQPTPEVHHINRMEEAVHKLMDNYEPLDSEMR